MSEQADEKYGTEEDRTSERLVQEQHGGKADHSLSRRKLLASIGWTGTAVIAGAVLNNSMINAGGGPPSSVTGSVYGGGCDLSDLIAKRGFIDVKADFGAVGDGIADDTAALSTAFASGLSQRFHMPSGTYKITLTETSSLAHFTNKRGIHVFGDGAVIMDTTFYTKDALTPIFLFDHCTDVSVTGVHYEGVPLANPASKLGYLGATFVRAVNGTEVIRVDAVIKHCRYGVQSGSYPDETLGNCKTFHLNLRTDFVGYPVAVYLAEDVKADIYAENVHRCAYLAGVVGADIDAKFKNQYIADIMVLITDAKAGTNVSRGGKNIKVNAMDLGSTVFELSSSCAGITLSRVDPGTTFSDIEIRFHVTATDTVATRVGGFKVASGVKSVQPQYPYNWETSIYLTNIKISGVIDRSDQTLPGNTAGDIYVNTVDVYPHYATVSNFQFEGVTIIPSTGNTRNNYFTVPGLKDTATFVNYVTPNLGMNLLTNTTSEVSFVNSRLNYLNGTTSKISLLNTAITTMEPVTLTNASIFQSPIGGASSLFKSKQIELTLTGGSVTWAGAIPTGALMLGLTGLVTQAITGSTGFSVGVAGDPTRFVNTNGTVAGTTFKPANQNHAEESPRYYYAMTDIIVTSKTADFTAGKLKLYLMYVDFTTPL